ncbi:SMI1/KNR4 family protein [Photorhabdus tasmaniensis]
MNKIEALVQKLSSLCEDEVVWHTPVDNEQIRILEKKLNIIIPDDYKFFLKKTGGGGVVEQEISGIEDNNALIDYGGTIYGDTTRCRSEFQLPKHLAVIYMVENEIYWCIDSSPSNFGKIVNYDPYLKKIDAIISDSFTSFFEEYVELRTQ